MSTPHHTSAETLALVVQYLYETDPDFEKAMDKVLFPEEPSKNKKPIDKKKPKKSKFTLKCLVKKQTKMKVKRRRKES
ncbi:MAG: hypothetical protein V4509_04315 [Patescibacteria group bacterium]